MNMPSSPPPNTTDAAESVRRTAEARLAVTASLHSIGTSIDAEMRYRTADLHSNSIAISKQEKDLAKQTAAMSKDIKEWEKLLSKGEKGVKETGDIQNWAEMLERDLLVLEETCRLVDEGEDRDVRSER
jgi:hypothetical protein